MSTNTRELTRADLDLMISEGTVSSQHPLIQQLAANRIQEIKALKKRPPPAPIPHNHRRVTR